MQSRTSTSVRWFIPVSVLILLVGYMSGAVWPNQFAHTLAPLIKQLRDLAVSTESHHSVLRTILTIFVHNVVASVTLIALGLLAGIYPAVMMWMNGLMMGFITTFGAKSLGVPAWKIVVFALAPHGIFEMTAIVWSAAIGIHLGFTAIHSVWRRLRPSASPIPVRTDSDSLSLRRELRRTFRSLPIIIGLLLLAACIEGGLTPHLIQWGITKSA